LDTTPEIKTSSPTFSERIFSSVKGNERWSWRHFNPNLHFAAIILNRSNQASFVATDCQPTDLIRVRKHTPQLSEVRGIVSFQRTIPMPNPLVAVGCLPANSFTACE
jgi:hypothetical protein